MDIAKDRADWLLDAVAMATQDRRFLRGDPQYDEVAGEALLVNAEKAIQFAITKSLEAHTQSQDSNLMAGQQGTSAGGTVPLHAFRPNRKYPWICANCGYSRDEPLKHRRA